jgi:hypothetical protein
MDSLGNLGCLLLVKLSKDLSHLRIISCTASNQLAISLHDHIDTNQHGLLEHWKTHTVKVLSHLSVHLFEQVRENTKR